MGSVVVPTFDKAQLDLKNFARPIYNSKQRQKTQCKLYDVKEKLFMDDEAWAREKGQNLNI